MDRVATYNAGQTALSYLMAAEVRQNAAQMQVSSGQVATDLQGFGGTAATLTATQSTKIRTDGFLDSLNMISARLEAQDAALGQVASAGSAARQAVAEAVASGRADGLKQALDAAVNQAASGLDTQFNGQYLFAGGQVSTPPVAASVRTLADLDPPPAGGYFTNDSYKTVDRIDENTTLQTGVLASDVGQPLFDALRQVAALGPFNGALTSAQSAGLTSLLKTLDSANQNITDITAGNGVVQSQVSQAQTTLGARQTMLKGMIGQLSDADVAQAATNLNLAQISIQAAAKVLQTLQSSSLLNYLNGSGGA